MNNMFKFSDTSKKRLETCHTDLQVIFNQVIKYIDCSIICGIRGKEEQETAFNTGKSKLIYPNSPHNIFPSMAVDVAPYPINWIDFDRFYILVGWLLLSRKSY